jgi:hypothetical protein
MFILSYTHLLDYRYSTTLTLQEKVLRTVGDITRVLLSLFNLVHISSPFWSIFIRWKGLLVMKVIITFIFINRISISLVPNALESTREGSMSSLIWRGGFDPWNFISWPHCRWSVWFTKFMSSNFLNSLLILWYKWSWYNVGNWQREHYCP